MAYITVEKIDISKFWEKTPTPLKYVLVFVVILTIIYYMFIKELYVIQKNDIDKMKKNIELTNDVISNFDNFSQLQDHYNDDVILYIVNLHSLVEELNNITTQQILMSTTITEQNKKDILDKINLLNQSFNKLSSAYDIELQKPTYNKINKNELNKIKINTRGISNDSIK